MTRLKLTLLLCIFAATLYPGATTPLPEVYINMEFSMTWSEFCLLERYFKSKLSENLIQRNGQQIAPSRVYLQNFEDNCPPKDNVKKAFVTFYILTPGGTFQDVDVDMTKRAYVFLDYLVKNRLEALFGDLFQGKVKKVEIAGEKAPQASNELTELERTYIALGIATGVIALIVLIIATMYFIKNRRNQKYNDRGRKLRKMEENTAAMELVESPPETQPSAPEQSHVYQQIVESPPPNVYENPQVPANPDETRF